MTHLIIDYRLDSKRPGYDFVPPTDGFEDAILKAVWRSAMPRGQGWGEYAGARSLKCFPVDKRIIAISDIEVTDRADEQGRRGIRRAAIELVPVWNYHDALKTRLAALPGEAADQQLTLTRWLRIIERALPKVRRKQGQAILAYPFHTPDDWAMVEALALQLAVSWRIRALWGKSVSLTTLALTHRDESQIVALPADKAASVKDLPVIDLT